MRVTSAATSATGSRRVAAAAAVGALLAQHRGQVAVGVEQERVRAVGPTIESSTSRSTFCGNARAYWSATCVPYEIPISATFEAPSALRSVSRSSTCRRSCRTRAAARSAPRSRELAGRTDVERAQRLQRRAAQHAGLAGAALVERRRGGTGAARAQARRRRGREVDRPLARAAGQGEEDLPRARERAARREVQRDRPAARRPE
jgi:hypothetical protein